MSKASPSGTRRQERPSAESHTAARGEPCASTTPTTTKLDPSHVTAVGRASVESGNSDRVHVSPSPECHAPPTAPSDSSAIPTATNPGGPQATSTSPASGPLVGIMSPTARSATLVAGVPGEAVGGLPRAAGASAGRLVVAKRSASHRDETSPPTVTAAGVELPPANIGGIVADCQAGAGVVLGVGTTTTAGAVGWTTIGRVGQTRRKAPAAATPRRATMSSTVAATRSMRRGGCAGRPAIAA